MGGQGVQPNITPSHPDLVQKEDSINIKRPKLNSSDFVDMSASPRFSISDSGFPRVGLVDMGTPRVIEQEQPVLMIEPDIAYTLGIDSFGESTDGKTFEAYVPQKLKIGNKHPDSIVETSSLSANRTV